MSWRFLTRGKRLKDWTKRKKKFYGVVDFGRLGWPGLYDSLDARRRSSHCKEMGKIQIIRQDVNRLGGL